MGVGGLWSRKSSPRPCSCMVWHNPGPPQTHHQGVCPLQSVHHAAPAGRRHCCTASPNCTLSRTSRLPPCSGRLRPQRASQPESHSEGRGLAQCRLSCRHRRRSCGVGGLQEAWRLGNQRVRECGVGGQQSEGSRVEEAAGRGTAVGRKLIVGAGFKEAKRV